MDAPKHEKVHKPVRVPPQYFHQRPIKYGQLSRSAFSGYVGYVDLPLSTDTGEKIGTVRPVFTPYI